MADSDAARSRRSRLHRRGDHSLCDRRRCRLAAPDDADPVPAPLAAGEVLAEVDALLTSLDLAPGDPRLVIAQCARRLAVAMDLGQSPAMLARELRGCVRDMTDRPHEQPNELDAARAARHVRRLDAHFGTLVSR